MWKTIKPIKRTQSVNPYSVGFQSGTEWCEQSSQSCQKKKAPRHSVQNQGAYEIPTDRHLPPLWVVTSLWGLRAKEPVLHTLQDRRSCSTLSIQKFTLFRLTGWIKVEGAKWKLHPLIHTYEKACCQGNWSGTRWGKWQQVSQKCSAQASAAFLQYGCQKRDKIDQNRTVWRVKKKGPLNR